MIEITGVQKKYGSVHVLDDIQLTIDTGSIYGIVGRSGAGKSTLLRCINGLTDYDSGSIKIDGVEIRALSPRQKRAFRKDIGMIFQHFSLLKQLDVYGNVALPLKCWGYKRKYIDEKVRHLLEVVDISGKTHAYPSQLSGGQKQRVAIARALAMDPKVLLCDEATSALDPNTAAAILSLLKEINKRMDITLIIVTHQMAVIRSTCQHVAIIEDGKITVHDNVEKIFREEPPALRNLMGIENGNWDHLTGTNMKVTITDEMTRTPVFSRLTRELGVDIVILSGETNRFNDTVMSSFHINVPEEDVKNVERYFLERNITCKIAPPKENEKSVPEVPEHV